MSTASRPIAIAAGGTGGHVFPALAVADVLREQGIPVVWFGTKRGIEARVIPEADIPMVWLSVSGLRGKGLLSRVLGPVRLMTALVQSIRAFIRLKPSAVLGMGGYVTGPVGVAAKLTGCPLVLHEQNAVAGYTNKKLARFASVVFSAMPNAFDATIKAITVGNPLRLNIEQFADEKANAIHANNTTKDVLTKEKNEARLSVLIVGGSQGAQVLNNVVPEVIKHANYSLKVVHQTGLSMYVSTKDRYDSHTETEHEIDVKKFIENMMDAYLEADLIICRSGAMTVSEIAAMSLPSVLVPYPHAVDDHQTKNAKFLEQAGAAVVIPQREFTAEKLSEVLTNFHENRNRLKQMGKAARQCHLPTAAQQVASALLNFELKVNSQKNEVNI